MAGVFQVMALGVSALNEGDVDPSFMAKLAKIATTEMISSKVHYFVLMVFVSHCLVGDTSWT
jgi:hypothetical protein